MCLVVDVNRDFRSETITPAKLHYARFSVNFDSRTEVETRAEIRLDSMSFFITGQ